MAHWRPLASIGVGWRRLCPLRRVRVAGVWRRYGPAALRRLSWLDDANHRSGLGSFILLLLGADWFSFLGAGAASSASARSSVRSSPPPFSSLSLSLTSFHPFPASLSLPPSLPHTHTQTPSRKHQSLFVSNSVKT